MNKLLLVEDIKNITNASYLITYEQDITLDIIGAVTLANYDSKPAFTLNLQPNSSLKFTQVLKTTHDLHLTFNLQNASTLNYNLVILNTGSNKIKLEVNMPENHSKANLKIRCLNLKPDSHLDLICDGKVASHTKDNELIEDLKGLILNTDTIKISPNMFVATEEVMASHFVTIGSFNKEDLFYLNSQGLSTKLAQDLLLKGFLTANLDSELQEKIQMEVINYE